MSSTTWHVPSALLDDYRAGRLEAAQVMSVDAHLQRCALCRAALPGNQDWLAHNWEGLVAAVTQPRLTLAERLLRRCGVPEHLARLLAGTSTLSRAWLAAVTLVLAVTVVITNATQDAAFTPASLLPFLLVAPVLPVAGIAVAYGRSVDPAYELLAATPLAGARLLLLRASAVLVAALVPAGLATPLLPGPPLLGAAWLLPALALTTACLALATRMPVPVAAGGLAVAWAAAVLLIGGLSGERLLPFFPAAQLAYAVTVALFALVVYGRRRYLDPGEPRWNPLSGFAR
jgi:hypothetical protein